MASDFNSDRITVSLPLRDVLALYDLVKDFPTLMHRLHELESEVDALRSIQSHMMVMFGDQKKSK